jgi:hypothetical protein
MEVGSPGALDAVIRPQSLRTVAKFNLLEGLFAGVRGGEGIVVGSVPVLGEDDVLEMLCGAMDRPDDRVTVGNGECAAGAEIVLHVDDKEDVVGRDPHKGVLGCLIPFVSYGGGQDRMTRRPREILQSIGALFAGFVVNVALSLGTDVVLHAVGITPALGQTQTDSQLLLATAYRTLYGVVSSYVVARLAPNRPMGHALLGGAIGMALGTVGAVATWIKGLGPHWYPLALIVTALPSAWVGGKLRVMQLAGRMN